MNKNKKTTETYAVKLDSEVKEELQSLIKEYNDQGTQGDFMRLLVETFKTNKLSDNLIDTKSELRELNSLTTRIYNLYSNLIERNNTSLEGVKTDISDQIQSKENIIINLKDDIKKLNETNNNNLDKIAESNNINDKLLNELEQLKDRNSKDTLLIQKLTEELENSEQFKVENKTMEKQFKEMESSLHIMTEFNKQLQDTIELNDRDIDEVVGKLKDTQIKHQSELDNEKLKYEKSLEIIDAEYKREVSNIEQNLESKYMKETLKLKEDFQKEIKHLQDKSFEDKESLQDKYSERLDKVEQEKQILQKQIDELKQNEK